MAHDAEAALTDLSSGAVSYGHYTSTIILMDEDAAKLEAAVRYLCKVVSYGGFVVRDEDVNAVEAFLGSIPGMAMRTCVVRCCIRSICRTCCRCRRSGRGHRVTRAGSTRSITRMVGYRRRCFTGLPMEERRSGWCCTKGMSGIRW